MLFSVYFRTVRRPVGRKNKLASVTSLICCRKSGYRRIARNRQARKSSYAAKVQPVRPDCNSEWMPVGVYGGAVFVEKWTVD